ncbi:MAG: Wzz/FepE/Etk N-terminal domain-containing protein [Bacillota bacterium]|nr:Wzz/FepE/Etk N-terminal domain-containing protein [Bacillota bacterium]
MEEQNFEEISLREIYDVLMQRRWLIVALTVTAVLASVFFTSTFVTPIYRSSAVLMVTHADTQRVVRTESDLEEMVAQVSRPQEMSINTYLGQFNNEALMERVIDRLEINLGPRTLAGMIRTSAVRDTRLIEVSVEHNDPYTAALIANTVSEEFIEFISDINQQRMSQSVDFLQEQRDDVVRQLAETMNKYREYESDPRSAQIVQMELDSRLKDSIRYQSEIIQTQIEYEQLLAGRNELLKRLEQEPATFVTLLGEDGSEETANPVYLSLRQSIDEKEVEIQEKQALTRSLERAVTLLERQVRELQVELNEKNAFERVMLADIQLLEKNSALFAERITQAQIARSVDMGANNLTLVSRAVQPGRPIRPNTKKNAAVAGVLGVMASVMLVFAVEFLDNSIKNEDDVRRHLDLPVLAQVPKFR